MFSISRLPFPGLPVGSSIARALVLESGFPCAAGLSGPSSLLQEHCLQCHGEKKQKGDRHFDPLSLDLSGEETAFDWQEILDLEHCGVGLQDLLEPVATSESFLLN